MAGCAISNTHLAPAPPAFWFGTQVYVSAAVLILAALCLDDNESACLCVK